VDEVLLGVGLGVATSLVSWWIVARFFRPRLAIIPEISKLEDDTGVAPWRYRVKVLNQRRLFLHSPAVDLQVAVTLHIRGLRSPKNWNIFRIPTGQSGQLTYVKQNRVLRLRLYEISNTQARLLPEPLQAAVRDGTVELESLLALGSSAHLNVVVTAAHAYTFGRTVAVQRFTTESIRLGPFDLANDRVRELSVEERPAVQGAQRDD
jgi:hypothetical protein